MPDLYPEDYNENKETLLDKLSDITGFIGDIMLWPVDKLMELDMNKGKKMTIKWLGLLPSAGFDVSEYEIPEKGKFDNGGMIEIYYRGKCVLSMSNEWSFFWIKSFIQYDEDVKWGSVENVKISSKKDLVRFLEAVREEVYPNMNKCDIVDKLLDVTEDL